SAVMRMIRSDTTCRRTSAASSAAGRTTTSLPTCSQRVSARAPPPARIAASGRASSGADRRNRCMASVLAGLDVGGGAVGRQARAQQLHGVGEVQSLVGLDAVPVAVDLAACVHVAAFLDPSVDQPLAFRG